MSLATDSDLEARLGRNLTTTEASRADALLADVSAAVSAYCGRSFTRRTCTAKSRGRHMVRLPQSPVHSIESVVDQRGDPITYEWDGDQRIYLQRSNSTAVAFVSYVAGNDDVPPAIIGVVCSVALRALGADPLDGGIRQESIDGYSYTLGSAGSAGAFGLLPDERQTLDRFRVVTLGSFRVAW